MSDAGRRHSHTTRMHCSYSHVPVCSYILMVVELERGALVLAGAEKQWMRCLESEVLAEADLAQKCKEQNVHTRIHLF